jgi:TolB-like protein
VFTPVPRTRAIENLMKEQQFQRSGLTDSDTIAELGKQLNADYVLAGHIAALGNSKLLLITIINVSELRQIAGDYREYQRIESVIDMMPDMAKRIGEAATRRVSGLPGLAVLPFNVLSSGVNQQDAEILAQLLATEIANSGRYAVFPRTKAIEKVMEEHHIERSGMTDAESMKAIGEAVNAQYVLSANVRKLGEDNYFSASILHIVEASQGKGTREKYQTVGDGLVLMPKIAQTLTGTAGVAANAAPIGSIPEHLRGPELWYQECARVLSDYEFWRKLNPRKNIRHFFALQKDAQGNNMTRQEWENIQHDFEIFKKDPRYAPWIEKKEFKYLEGPEDYNAFCARVAREYSEWLKELRKHPDFKAGDEDKYLPKFLEFEKLTQRQLTGVLNSDSGYETLQLIRNAENVR